MRAAFAKRVGPTDRKKLIAGIHAQASALQLPDDVRKDMQLKLVGVTSTKDMTPTQLTTVWQRLTTLAKDAGLAKSRRKGRPGRDERQPDELVTTEQTQKISELFDLLGIAAVGQARMNFSRRTCGSTWPQTREQANKVIEGLKAMEARGWKARGSAAGVNGKHTDEPAFVGGSRSSRGGASSIDAGQDEISTQPTDGDTVHESPVTP